MRNSKLKINANTPANPRRVLQTAARTLISAGVVSTLLLASGPGIARAAGRAGSLDTSFGTNGVVQTQFASGMNVSPVGAFEQSNGDIVVVAAIMQAGSGVQDFGLIRYTPAGKPDPSFGENGMVLTSLMSEASNSPNGFAVQPNGDIIVAGTVTIDNSTGISPQFGLARYTPNGALDTSFGTGGIVTTTAGEMVEALLLQPDGQILVSGFQQGTDAPHHPGTHPAMNVLVRFTSSGRLDTTFGSGGIARSVPVFVSEQLALLSNGDYLIVGPSVAAEEFSTPEEFSSAGALLPALSGVAITATSNTSDILFQADGNYIISQDVVPPAGSAAADTGVSNASFPRRSSFVELAGFTQAGDSTFTTTPFPFIPITSVSQLGSDNQSQAGDILFTSSSQTQIVLAGDLTGTVGTPSNSFALARFNRSGGTFVLDTTFGNGGTVTTPIGAGAQVLLLQSDGKIVVVGDGRTTLVLARYLAN